MASDESKYESAEYRVVVSDGKFEVREYPDLMLAATRTSSAAEDSGGSFMRLFRYITGGNRNKQQISMTTPVFMERELAESDAQMGFVVPQKVVAQGAPAPTVEHVELRKRIGGRFAVVRFSGLMTSNMVEEQAAELQAWILAKGLLVEDTANGRLETAAYDSPFTPPSQRRNELLIRLQVND